MQTWLCGVLSAFNLVKLFQLCQGFALTKAFDCMAKNIIDSLVAALIGLTL